MKIRTALTLKNSFVTAAVFALCLSLVYVASERIRSNTFFHDLRSEAVTKAHLFLGGQVDSEIMQSIYLNNRKFINEVEVAVYDTSFLMLYHDAVQNDIIKEDSAMIQTIVTDGDMEFYVDGYQCIGMLYDYGGRKYVVTAAAYDGYGYDNLASLLNALIVLFVVGLSLLFVSGYYLSRAALKPIRDIVAEAENITATSISRRLPVKNEKDELGELATAFNDLLSRLEESFNSQKMFVSNVSHELRTPLAALMAELGITLQKERTQQQYRDALDNVMNDARRMNSLIDRLLNLAKADYGKEQISMQEIRLDELLLDVRECILRAHPEYKIELVFDEQETDDDRFVTVYGNSYLLSIAFSNLIENNCKYSPDRTSFVQISFWNKWTVVRMSDNGAGLSDDERQNMFKLFYRGKQEHVAAGHGIGMALARKIINLHQGKINVLSDEGKGTTFVVEMEHL